MNKNKNLQNSEVFILQNMASSWKIKTILNMQYLCWKKNPQKLKRHCIAIYLIVI